MLTFVLEKLGINHGFLRHFALTGFKEFKDYAKQSSDKEWLGKIKIVETYRHELPFMIKLIKARMIADCEMAGKKLLQIFSKWIKFIKFFCTA